MEDNLMSYFDRTKIHDGTETVNVTTDNRLESRSSIVYKDETGALSYDVDVQNPIPTDGDTVYLKDVWESESSMGDFTGDFSNLFTNVYTDSVNSTSDNPKSISIRFNRIVFTSVIGLGAKDGTFSNVKIIAKDAAGTARITVDDSANSTTYTSWKYPLSDSEGFIEMEIQFHTANQINLNAIVIPKLIRTISRLQAIKPDSTETEINATVGGNLKISLEELENTISVNSNSQLRTTQYDSSGNEISSEQLLAFTDNLDGQWGLVTASALFGRIDNDTLVPVKLEGATQDIQVIDHGHAETHSGDHHFIKNWTDIAGSTTIDFLAVTPNTTKWGHLVVEFSFEAEATITIYEGATTSADGAAVSSFNRDRNSANTAAILVYSGPTVTTTGTQIAAYITGSGGKVGGTIRSSAEVILKQNTKYLIRITNNTATNNWCDYLADWYEHTNKN